MNTPTPEQIAKLPKWARDHITYLECRANQADAIAKTFTDTQTESPFFLDGWYMNGVRRYIHSPTNQLTVQHAGVNLEIFLSRPDDGQRPYGIELTFSGMAPGGKRSLTGPMVAVAPRGWNQIFLLSKDNLK